MGTSRFPLLKDVPTVGETYPGYVADSWAGLFVPIGTPEAVIKRLRAAAERAMEIPDVKEKLGGLGITAASDPSPEAFKAMMAEEREKWTRLIKQIGPVSAN
jgi:tripartite-type tricarboxylate transporter receptor subunit TctC